LQNRTFDTDSFYGPRTVRSQPSGTIFRAAANARRGIPPAPSPVTPPAGPAASPPRAGRPACCHRAGAAGRMVGETASTPIHTGFIAVAIVSRFSGRSDQLV